MWINKNKLNNLINNLIDVKIKKFKDSESFYLEVNRWVDSRLEDRNYNIRGYEREKIEEILRYKKNELFESLDKHFKSIDFLCSIVEMINDMQIPKRYYPKEEQDMLSD